MIERGVLQSRFAEIGVDQARMDKIGMCEICCLQTCRRQRGETEHRLLQARDFRLIGARRSSPQFALACGKHNSCEVWDGGRPLLAFHAAGRTQDFGMMTDRRQRCTVAATQLHSILIEIGRRTRLDMREIKSGGALWRLRHPQPRARHSATTIAPACDQEMKTDGEVARVACCFAFAFRPHSLPL